VSDDCPKLKTTPEERTLVRAENGNASPDFIVRLIEDADLLERALEWYADVPPAKALASWWADTEDERRHLNHGRGNAEDGPDDPDCPCLGTTDQPECAVDGCGFCKFAEMICENCNGRGTMGYIVGGISFDCTPPKAHEPECPDCKGLGLIENV
jgi:hypothetical protein